jgi:hypothetical protein
MSLNLAFHHPIKELLWVLKYSNILRIDYNIIINNNIDKIKAIHDTCLPDLCKYKIINELLLQCCKDYFNENKTYQSKYEIDNYSYYIDT